ncbi:MAG: acetyl-CoA acetyltransferase [Acidimicrobiales bacterium]
MPVPVLVGAGHETRRVDDPSSSAEPAELIGNAVRLALDDAGVGRVDHLAVVNLLSWRYGDPVGAVARFAGVAPAAGVYSPVGGDQPGRLLVAAARLVAAGEADVCVVAGGEALHARRLWERAGERPPWTPPADPPGGGHLLGGLGLGHGARQHGLTRPVEVYPLVENARRASLGVPFGAEQKRSARLWAAMSSVAARTPGAWAPAELAAEDIVRPGPGNRWIAHPYLTRMCARPVVDQAAAVVVASTDAARRAGVPEEGWVYLWADAGAADTTELLERPTYAASAPLERVLRDALRSAGVDPGAGLRELYSCFPIVPKLALDALGLDDAVPITVAGGLSSYGGPLNAYVLCAAVAMLRALRRGEAEHGLLHGNGEHLTQQHALVVGRRPGPGGAVPPVDDRAGRQADLDRHRPAVVVAEHPGGPATVETSTVVYDRDGGAARGVVIGRLADGRRFVAGTDDLDPLLDPQREAVGLAGVVRSGWGKGTNRFSFA